MLYGSGWQRSLTLQVLQSLESTFSLRLPDETYRGLFNYMMATIPAASMDEIQTALVSWNNSNRHDLIFQPFMLISFYRNICT